MYLCLSAWHPSTWHWLRDTPEWAGEHVLGMSFYTDGSASRRYDVAAAGAVLIVHAILIKVFDGEVLPFHVISDLPQPQG